MGELRRFGIPSSLRDMRQPDGAALSVATHFVVFGPNQMSYRRRRTDFPFPALVAWPTVKVALQALSCRFRNRSTPSTGLFLSYTKEPDPVHWRRRSAFSLLFLQLRWGGWGYGATGNSRFFDSPFKLFSCTAPRPFTSGFGAAPPSAFYSRFMRQCRDVRLRIL